MGIRFFLFNLTDGQRLQELKVRDGSWSIDLDEADSLDCELRIDDPTNAKLNLPNSATVGKSGLAAIDTYGDGTNVLAAGPLWQVTYDEPSKTVKLNAKGIRSFLDHRYILPPSARTANVTTWTIPDPSDTTKTMANPALASTYSGISLATIGKRLVAQMMAWPSGSLPIILPADEADANVDHQRTYEGVDFKPVGEALDDLTNLIGGPEFAFVPQFTSDRLAIQWVMLAGTIADPLIHSNRVTRWYVTADQSPITDLSVVFDASNMGSLAWVTGGRSSDDFLLARTTDSTLTDAGYPFMEVLDSSHTSVSVQTTLDGYAAGIIKGAKLPTENWSFSVKAHPVDENGQPAGPQLGDYAVGDFIQLVFNAYDPETGRGDLFFREKQIIPLRIVGISASDALADVVRIQTAPVVG